MYSPDDQHIEILKNKPLLAFDENGDFKAQKKQISEKFIELLGEMPKKVELDPIVEYTHEEETYTEYRISFQVEPKVRAICLLCIPKLQKEKYPLVICLQGHSPGMEVSMGRSIWGFDAQAGDRNFAIGALERGYATLSLEQRGMGERRSELREGNAPLPNDGNCRCLVTAMGALLVGRTIVAERCFDVSRAIDLALTYPQIDADNIICTGNSGGGTITYYAACLDERIRVAMPSCSVCTYRDSIGAMPHCSCNYIPGIARYLDMGDLAVMIAPRKLVVIHGDEDAIFPDHGVREAFDTIQSVYRAAGAEGNCALATGKGGHRYYKKEAWEGFERVEKS